METTTKKISEKLKNEVYEKLEPILEGLRKQGKSDKELEGFVITHVKMKIKHEYSKLGDMKHLSGIIDLVIPDLLRAGVDSNAEVLFYYHLKDNEIPFQYHYKIGPYTADYLIDENLVVELDGSQHNSQQTYDESRDRYMERMGYNVLRIPLTHFVLDKEAVIIAVQEARGISTQKEIAWKKDTPPVRIVEGLKKLFGANGTL